MHNVLTGIIRLEAAFTLIHLLLDHHPIVLAYSAKGKGMVWQSHHWTESEPSALNHLVVVGAGSFSCGCPRLKVSRGHFIVRLAAVSEVGSDHA